MEASATDKVLARLNAEFYDKYGLPHSAGVYRPSVGSMIISSMQ